MTPELPPSPTRPTRPGVAARRQALGLEGTEPASAAGSAPLVRESLRESLARIPDLEEAGPPVLVGASVHAGAAGVGEVVLADADLKESLRAAFAAPVAPPTSTTPSPGPRALPPSVVPPPPLPGGEPVAAATAATTAGRHRGGPRRPAPMWRRVAFAFAVVGLVASIPVLGYAGMQVIKDSTAGDLKDTNLSPTDPGYEAQVDPTPTAVAIQFDDKGLPNGVTFMALGGTSGGGAVIFVPLDTNVTEPSYGVDRLRTAYNFVADQPALARERLASQVGRLLNVGIDEIIDLGSSGWSQLVAPVAPLEIENPDTVDLGFGQVIPSGPATLAADQVGRYLAASLPGESDLNRLNRHAAVWSAWLAKVAASGRDDAVPGESSAGIGRFAKALAAGPVSYDTLPVTESPDRPDVFDADKNAVNDLITDTVASPTGAVPGGRFTVRLLNGVSPDAIPADLVRQVVRAGGAVTVLGNGPEFDSDETTIVYANPKRKQLAKIIAASMGATGTVRLDREAPDTVDLTIVLGKDILGDATGAGSPGATTPAESTTPGGD